MDFSGIDLPMGFGMHLIQNAKALDYFKSLSGEQQQDIIDKTHSVSSKQEMKLFVDSLPDTAFK